MSTAVGGAWTVWNPGLLKDPAMMDGSSRAAALVLVAVALPALVVSMLLAARGVHKAVITWLSALLFVTYNSVLLLFMTPFNAAFLGGATELIRFRLRPPLKWSCRSSGWPWSDSSRSLMLRRFDESRPGRSPGLSETPRRHPLGAS
jgi:hypothetical protein